jgi:hypothetical protein
MSNGQADFAEFYDKDEAARRFEAALRGARIVGHKSKTDIPKQHLKSQAARTQDLEPTTDQRFCAQPVSGTAR